MEDQLIFKLKKKSVNFCVKIGSKSCIFCACICTFIDQSAFTL